MAKTICVDPKQVDLIWPEVSHWIRAAYDHHDTDETFEETEDAVLSGNALLWIAIQGPKISAAAVTKIWTANKKICSILACGGSGKDWPQLLKPIENYAAAEDCSSVRISGRRGWARHFKDYHQPWIVIEKKLTDAGRRNV